MKWAKHDGYAILSEDGRCSICKIGAAYEVWRTRKHEDGPSLVSTNIADPQKARKLAAEDAADESRG